ncbi:SDR family oxidoreductase [bacterium]|nr:SDR family oxidoreductase [bacterium]
MSSCFRDDLFHGKKILITGCTSGIGKHVAIQLSKLGCSLLLVGRNSIKLDQLVHNLSFSNRHSKLVADLSLSDALFDLKSDIIKFGPLDGVFHSAGIGLIKPTKLLKSDDINHVFAPSVYAALDISRMACSSKVISPNSSIVFMSSVSSILGTSCMSLYSASKGAIDSLSRSLAVELAPRKIRVNSIVSGAVQTPMHENLSSSLTAEMLEDYRQRHPLGFGTSESISNAVIFLLSESSCWITGTQLIIDGGYSAQ